MPPAVLTNLRLALDGILQQMEKSPPFSQERARLHGEAELLRGIIGRAERRAVA